MKFIRNLEKTAIICDDKRISYTELLKKINNYSMLLEIKKEDKVAILSPNCFEFFYSFFSVWDKKGTVVPIDYSSNLDELTYILKDSVPKYIFTRKEKKELVVKAIEKSNLDIEIIVFEDIENIPIQNIREIDAPERENICVVLYTSGTTGNPKGVMLTFDNFLSQIESINKYKIYEENDRLLTLLPLHHIFPLLVSAIMPVYFGVTTVFITELASEKIKQAFMNYKITIFVGVPKLYDVFHKGIMKKLMAHRATELIFNLSKNIKSERVRKLIFKKIHEGFGGSIKYFVSGGAKLDEKISKDFRTFGFKILEGYGMTETAPIITFTKPNKIKPGSAGSPLDSIQIKISADGELLVKGRNVMKGYLNKPDKTKEIIDKDGWLHTGDLAVFDSENYIHIIGRKKEMIVLSNGKNVDPLSVENEIMKMSKGFIQEVAVFDYNDHLNALILPDYNHIEIKNIKKIKNVIKKSVMDEYNSKSISYKKVINFKIITHELPKTRLGKLKRFMLKDFIA